MQAVRRQRLLCCGGVAAVGLYAARGLLLASQPHEPVGGGAALGAAVGGDTQDSDSLSLMTMSLVAVVVIVSSAGGIGGGGVLVPVLMLSEDMGPHGAIPLSKLTIFGNAVCQLLLNFKKRHPLRPERPLIDYETTLMLEPPTLLGTVIGVLLNRMTPKWLIALLLLLFLVATTLRTSSKAVALYAQESRAAAAAAGFDVGADGKGQRAPAAKGAEAGGRSMSIPWGTIRQLGLVWCVVLGASLLRRRAGCGSSGYWLVLATLAAIIAALTRSTGRAFLARHTQRQSVRYAYAEGDVLWDDAAIVRLPLGCVAAGVLAGMLGVGGGMVMQPLMLELGMVRKPRPTFSASLHTRHSPDGRTGWAGV